MVNGCVLLIWIIFGVANADLQYYISDNTTSNNSVSTLCTLAAPPVEYSQNGNRVTINISSIYDPKGLLKKGQPVWIGYVEAYVTFLYKGCAFPRHVQQSSVHMNMAKDPGQCYSKCRTNLIGLQETTCHCITRLPAVNQTLEDGCNLSCSKPSGVICGSLHHVSVYQKVVHSVTGDYSDHFCSRFDNSSRTVSWDSCSTHCRVMCQTYDNSIRAYDRYCPWKEAMQTCLSNSTLPVNNLPPKHLAQHGGVLLWMGNIRSIGIFPFNDDMHGTEGTRQGFVKFINGRINLFFDQVQQKMHAICAKGTNTTKHIGHTSSTSFKTSNTGDTTMYTNYATNGTDTTKHVEHTTSTSFKTSKTGVTTTYTKYAVNGTGTTKHVGHTSSTSFKTSNTGDTTMHTNYAVNGTSERVWQSSTTSFKTHKSVTSGTSKHTGQTSTTSFQTRNTGVTIGESEDRNESEKSSRTGLKKVVLFIVIPVSLLVIIGIGVFVLWKRCTTVRKRTNDNLDDKFEGMSASIATTDTKLDSEPYSKEQIDNYHIIEPMNTYDSIKTVGDDVPYESEYDTTTSGVSKVTVNPYDCSSVYNKLDNVDTYNHLGGVVRAAAEFDNTYNHTANSTSAVPKCDKVNNYPDDLYSKVQKRM